ncbi:MAG: Sporulation inhibitor KipI [Candidatus Accumulibacter sp. SK-11]|nr:MAG: Sporulation inhibitor KipI [Candidatus Accumulibacter sp. SK-11]
MLLRRAVLSYRILALGDAALTIEFGDAIDRRLLAEVAAADQALLQAVASGQLPGIVETVPTFRSLTVIYDPLRCTRAGIEPAIHVALRVPFAVAPRRPRVWQLPVCYGDAIAACGPDLDELAAACGLSAAELVRLHAGGCYEVYMLGFLPGFPFMGDLPPRLARGRRSEPRTRVAAGSVATAGTLTAIYPWESPGGWHLIGVCPLPLFSPCWPQAALLQAGDQVRLRPIDAGEFASLQAAAPAMRAAAQPPAAFLCAAAG